MPTSVTVNDLKINELTEAQYDAAVQGGVIGENELSVITDMADKAVQVSELPTASATELGNIYQYVGATDANYTNGYFYKCAGTTTPSSATTAQTVGSTLSDIAVDIDTLEAFTGWTTDNSLQIFYTPDGWSVDTTSLGVTYTGTPNVGDAITITYTAAVTTYTWTRIDVQPAGATIDDTSTSSLTATWSANKLNTTIGNIETLLAQI